jgi:hypothetical protein
MKNETSGMGVSFFPFAPFLQWKRDESIMNYFISGELKLIREVKPNYELKVMNIKYGADSNTE